MKRLVAPCRVCGRSIVWLHWPDPTRRGGPERRRVCVDMSDEALRLARLDEPFALGDRRVVIHHKTCRAPSMTPPAETRKGIAWQGT